MTRPRDRRATPSTSRAAAPTRARRGPTPQKFHKVMVDSNVLSDARKSPAQFQIIAKWTLEQGGRVLIAAPSIAEMNRRAPFDIRTTGFEPVAFGVRASEAIGKALFEEMKGKTPAGTGDRTCLKFDLMILGCAMTAKVDVLLTTDPGLTSRANRVGIRATSPTAFIKEFIESRQLTLSVGKTSKDEGE